MTTTADTEVRERIALRGKARLGDFLEALLSRPATDRRHGGVPRRLPDLPMAVEGGLSVPFDLWEPRAAGDHPGRGSGEHAVAHLAVRVPSLDRGLAWASSSHRRIRGANFVTVTTAPPSDQVAKDADAPVTAGALTLVTRNPKRVTGAFEVRREDIAVMATLESDLLMALGGAVRNETDIEVISDLLTAATDVSAASATETFATGVARFAALVDGQFSDGMGGLRPSSDRTRTVSTRASSRATGDVSLYDYLPASWPACG